MTVSSNSMPLLTTDLTSHTGLYSKGDMIYHCVKRVYIPLKTLQRENPMEPHALFFFFFFFFFVLRKQINHTFLPSPICVQRRRETATPGGATPMAQLLADLDSNDGEKVAHKVFEESGVVFWCMYCGVIIWCIYCVVVFWCSSECKQTHVPIGRV